MLGKIGKRQIEQLSSFTTSAGVFGAAGFLGLCYFTDWRWFVTYIPFYNTKFPKQEEESEEK